MIELRRNMMAQKAGGMLPAEYQQVEYIETTGTQYLYFVPHPNVKKIEIEWEFVKLGNYFVLGGGYTGQEIYIWSKQWDGYFKNLKITDSPQINVVYKAIITLKKSELYKDDIYIGDGGKLAGNFVIYLNIMHRSNSSGYAGFNRFRHVKVENDTLSSDLIPCYRKADNVAGMYDIVNDIFHTNAGTGEFIVGPDVN